MDHLACIACGQSIAQPYPTLVGVTKDRGLRRASGGPLQPSRCSGVLSLGGRVTQRQRAAAADLKGVESSSLSKHGPHGTIEARRSLPPPLSASVSVKDDFPSSSSSSSAAAAAASVSASLSSSSTARSFHSRPVCCRARVDRPGDMVATESFPMCAMKRPVDRGIRRTAAFLTMRLLEERGVLSRAPTHRCGVYHQTADQGAVVGRTERRYAAPGGGSVVKEERHPTLIRKSRRPNLRVSVKDREEERLMFDMPRRTQEDEEEDAELEQDVGWTGVEGLVRDADPAFVQWLENLGYRIGGGNGNLPEPQAKILNIMTVVICAIFFIWWLLLLIGCKIIEIPFVNLPFDLTA